MAVFLAGNFKKSKQILQKGRDCRAVPAEMITLAMKNLQLKKPQLISEEDKENLSLFLSHTNGENVQNPVPGRPQKMPSDSSEELSANMLFSIGQKFSSPEECDEMPRKTPVNVPNRMCQFGRVPVQSSTSPEADVSSNDLFSSSNVKRQPLGAMRVPVLPLSKPKYGGDYEPLSKHKGKRMSIEPSIFPMSKRVSPPAPSIKREPALVCATPAKVQAEDYMNCFRTPVVKNSLGPLSLMSTPCENRSSYLPHTPANSSSQPLPIAPLLQSSECIVLKGRVYAVLKQIGTGGSSKVFQVMDDKKHLYAIKYVDLEEADNQTIESYQNEISHLKKLQQHSDKIIRLYDYEITKEHIYMVMECGNIDLNTWLRKKKTINPWERKSYWKNMLEAVGTINYMPPEAIKDTSFGDNGRPRSKISPKGDVWSLGCILYCMTYGKTPFQHITNQITKLHAILDPMYVIEIPDIPEKDLQDVLRKCLVRNPKERISITELLAHQYVQIQPHARTEEQVQKGTTEEMKRILGQLIGLNSPNSICRAAKSLYDQCNSGKSLDLTTISKRTNQNTGL
ncbi:hypothetical protein GDO78_001534 [Eleutherodactylus coqui]|uniref:Protein kinase domain-containing protein n=1 Tax=Eleutherodactylus coqui TaxID=57060 RepID=A0A8J6FW17_ELECQ|nr:hypothetical protein GDO78_001534 [Eleutherodactylus coqui]